MWHLSGVLPYFLPNTMVFPKLLEYYLQQECLKVRDYFICGGYLLWFIYLWHQLTSFLHFPSTVPDQQAFLIQFNLLCVLMKKTKPKLEPYTCFWCANFLASAFVFAAPVFQIFAKSLFIEILTGTFQSEWTPSHLNFIIF